LLTDGIDQHPHSVLLLDEIEKAHPDLFNILLQIMDHGKLTDHNGKKVNFQNVILIMTTNAGASDLAKAAIGFNRSKREGDDEEAINRLFSPEFRNRLDAIITFANLTPEIIAKVVEKFVFQLEAQLGDRNITIELTPESNAWLAERGYDDKFGARPLARVIQEHIKKPLAEEILFGALKDGGIVRVLVQQKDGQKVLGFEFIKADAPIRPRGPDELEPEDLDAEDGPEGAKDSADGRKSAPKPKAKRAPRRPPGSRRPGARRGMSSSAVPKVPLGSR
jgi:ATP-dependent Clp protease ATP-binding subunit ClpA